MVGAPPGSYSCSRTHTLVTVRWEHEAGGVGVGWGGHSLLQYKMVTMRRRRRRPQPPSRGPRMSGVQESQRPPNPERPPERETHVLSWPSGGGGG